jgi:hypothetical protein
VTLSAIGIGRSVRFLINLLVIALIIFLS